ncbi:hypothetical protein PR048_010639 [Dryococelus australis]|uniref:PiggyBac transposable element-derived protein domain-containing protein n=1 Tax=Dryococelus australis TaxID=614101 RepID=A0ABQ9I3A0_9NEOP|nr:hypothetical protein PR048_010639 [Dryococelus australis]
MVTYQVLGMLCHIKHCTETEACRRLNSTDWEIMWNAFVKKLHRELRPSMNSSSPYMANKPDKVGIKFWLAVDVDTKYIVNSFPCWGKDEQRPNNVRLAEHCVCQTLHNITVFKNDDITLTVYQGKIRKKCSCLEHSSSVEITADNKKTSETASYYNTKYGVDILYQMARL